MKRAAILIALLAALVSLHPATVSMVTFTWKPSPLNAGAWPVCSGSVIASCITGETLSDITNSTAITVASGISPNVLTYTLTPLPSVGTHKYALVYNAIDQSGNLVTSSQDQVTATIPSAIPNHPVALTVLFK